MIKDIPTKEEFDSAAKSQFDFAWDIVISFLLSLENAREYSEVDDGDEKAFWDSAHQRILTALIISQQGVELALKGKLVAISPFLLISGNPSDWPKDSTNTGISFSDFRAIDAQDLVRVHNTASDDNLCSEFSTLFDNLRRQRNKAMHTVDRNLKISATELLINILEFHKHLYGDENWIETRREFLYNSADTHVFFNTEFVESSVIKEFSTVFSFLSTAQVAKFFDINKKKIAFIYAQSARPRLINMNHLKSSMQFYNQTNLIQNIYSVLSVTQNIP